METRGSEPLDFLLIFELRIILVPLIILSHFCIEMQGQAWNSAYSRTPRLMHDVMVDSETCLIDVVQQRENSGYLSS